jgi:hypothetical protein
MPKSLALLTRTFIAWLSGRLALPGMRDRNAPTPRGRVVWLMALCIFLTALGVRLLHWQDKRIEVQQRDAMLTGLVGHYKLEARRMAKEGRILFPLDQEPGDARAIVHPPGYSILILAIYGKGAAEGPYTGLILFQVVCDAIAAVMAFFIALEFLPNLAALIAGLLVALSPHLAYYSLWLSPDSLAAVPILAAVYVIIRATKRPGFAKLMAAGLLVGLSCWLRSNAALLAPFIGVVIALLFRGRATLRYSLAFVAAGFAAIAPVTIRNLVVFNHFVPISLGAGITLIEGIADYDDQNRFGMPAQDSLVALKDVEWFGREDYAGNIWTPDGVERDRARFSRGLAVIRSNPGWFASVMVRRAAFMLRYNDEGSTRWPLGTSQIPPVSKEPAFGSSPHLASESQLVWSQEAAEILAEGEKIAQGSELALDGSGLLVAGDDSAFGDQFSSAPIPVKKNTDYVLKVPARLDQGQMAVKVTDAGRGIALASNVLERKDAKTKKDPAPKPQNEPDQPVDLPFASGERTEVRLVLSNDGQSGDSSQARINRVELFEMGPTPLGWTRFPRAVVRGAQRNLFTTSRMLALILAGIMLLALAGRWRAIAILIAVPAYYLSVQSALHTEYRYILTIHYFLFIFAAIALYLAGSAIGLGATRLINFNRRARSRT